jgi:precorrin-8X/cobalt-precorrin-8 methylmutase
MSEPAAYLRDGAAIYQRSFAIIRAEADLVRFSTDEADVAVRMIHACGVVELAPHIVIAHDLVGAPAARRSSVIPKWSRAASCERVCPRATQSSAR